MDFTEIITLSLERDSQLSVTFLTYHIYIKIPLLSPLNNHEFYNTALLCTKCVGPYDKRPTSL